jgi:hypothetical protein
MEDKDWLDGVLADDFVLWLDAVEAPVTVTVSVPSAVALTASVARTTTDQTCPSANNVLSATVTSPVLTLI